MMSTQSIHTVGRVAALKSANMSGSVCAHKFRSSHTANAKSMKDFKLKANKIQNFFVSWLNLSQSSKNGLTISIHVCLALCTSIAMIFSLSFPIFAFLFALLRLKS